MKTKSSAPLRVLVAVIENRSYVALEFVASMNGIRMAAGVEVELKPFDGPDQVAMRTAAAEYAVECGHDRVLMLDSDMVYSPETLLMLESAAVDVVNGFSLTRGVPHEPNWFVAPRGENVDEYVMQRAWPTTTGDAFGPRLHGPQEVYAVGGAALYVRTEVFRRLAEPWFDFRWHQKPDGRRTRVGEDIWFSHQCREAGVKLHTHADLMIGHIMPPTPVLALYDQTEACWKPRYSPRPTVEEARRREQKHRDDEMLAAEARAHRRDKPQIQNVLRHAGRSEPAALRATAEEADAAEALASQRSNLTRAALLVGAGAGNAAAGAVPGTPGALKLLS